MSEFKPYRRKGIAELREYIPGEYLDGVSVSEADKTLSKEEFDRGFIARNPDDHSDQWYVARAYFDANFEPVE